MRDRRILITGSAGSIGSELYRQLAPDHSILAFDQNESALFGLHEEHQQSGCDVQFRIGDVRDPKTVEELFEWKPDVVFHASALKHVFPMELFPQEAVETNVLGTINVVKAAQKAGVRTLVYVSTDKVVNPRSIMGATKKLGEMIARNAGYTAVRFGNVMGSRGSVLEIWERQVAANELITLTDPDAERYMMTIPDACKLLIKAAETGNPGDLLVMDMGQRVKMGDMAIKFLASHKKSMGYRLIGLRPGESLIEELMTSDEKKFAYKVGDFWRITA